ncbi:uncharacterized protein LOC116255853 [Nymphaea colorata]|nr:uncharacterized protein LOC116255853 [Nymphaea colorata]
MAATVAGGSEAAGQDGPVLSMMNKRLRALRKKYNRILQTEESKAQGKPINKEQEDVLRSKPAVVALIEEYEKLRQPLSAAVNEELSLFKAREEAALASASAASATVAATPVAEEEEEEEEEAVVDRQPEITERPPSASGDLLDETVEDLLKLLYFGTLFDVRLQTDFTPIMLTKAHERSSCLIYDYVTEDATDLLVERDLDLLSLMGSLIISRPSDSTVSHRNALQECVRHAKLWLLNSNQSIHPNAGVSYARLRERLNKILSSDYFTMTPQMTKLSQQTAAEAAAAVAAAAAGNYNPQIATQEPTNMQQQDFLPEEAVSHYQQVNDLGEYNGNDLSGGSSTHGDPSSPNVEQLPKAEEEDYLDPSEDAPNSPPPSSQDQPKQIDSEQNGDVEYRERENFPRRQYPNPRGSGRGGRRGYMNGRGGRGSRGGGFQNGRNQYYDAGNNYYPRNYYGHPRGRGRGGGMMYNNSGSQAAAGGRGIQMHGGVVAAEQA